MWTGDIGKEFLTEAVLFMPKFLTGAVLFGLFWLAAFMLRKLVMRVGTSRQLDSELTQFLASAARTVVVVFGAITALGTMGIDVGALIAGLGLTGFALGMAFKDVISNALSGILIIIYEPFGCDDHIKVSSFEGTVKSIDLRYTVLDREKEQVFVPNSLLFTNALTVTKAKDSSQRAED